MHTPHLHVHFLRSTFSTEKKLHNVDTDLHKKICMKNHECSLRKKNYLSNDVTNRVYCLLLFMRLSIPKECYCDEIT